MQDSMKALQAPSVRVNEHRDGLELSEIIDIASLQLLMDHFHKLTNMVFAILDLKGTILVAVGWQDICTKFHRVHPETASRCKESDKILTRGVEPGKYKLYRCQNGMWDVVTPLIIGGEHVGNIFMGQFLFSDEEPDREVFRKQAITYGFNVDEYIAALDRVPRLSRQTLDNVMQFYSRLAIIVSQISYSNVMLSKAMSEKKVSEERFRALFAAVSDPVLVAYRDTGILMECNEAAERYFGRSREQLIGLPQRELHPPETVQVEGVTEDFKHQATDPGVIANIRILAAGGEVKCVEVSASAFEIEEGRLILGVFRDVTDRKRAEEALRKSEDLLNASQSLSKVGGWEWNLGSKTMY